MSVEASRLLGVLRIVLWAAYALNWLGGVGGHLFLGGTPVNMAWAAPLFLLLASTLVVMAQPEDWRALLLSFLFGFIAEAIGVATGYPFGRYAYTPVLAPSVLGVPPVMAGAWMILVAWVRQMRLPFWGGALVMVAIDLLIDPLAANTLAFWKWQASGPYFGIPFSNFAGWFVVSLVILAFLREPPKPNAAVMAVGSSILLFFVLLGFAHGYFVPYSIGGVLCGGGYLRWRSSIKSSTI